MGPMSDEIICIISPIDEDMWDVDFWKRERRMTTSF